MCFPVASCACIPSWDLPFIEEPKLFAKVPRKTGCVLTLLYVMYFMKTKVFGVLHGELFKPDLCTLADRALESVVILPPHGIQLETHRGFTKRWPLVITRRFVPASILSGVVINEGLSGWNVLYHLVAVKSSPTAGTSLELAFQVSTCLPIKTHANLP